MQKEIHMKKHLKIFGIIALALALGFSMTVCGDDPEETSPETVTYTGTDGNGSTYTLTITETIARYTPKAGDSYKLTSAGKTSTGTVKSVSGGTFTLQPSSSGANEFTAKVSGTSLTEVTTVTWDDGSKATGTTTLTPPGGNTQNPGGENPGGGNPGGENPGGNPGGSFTPPATSGELTFNGLSSYNNKYIWAVCMLDFEEDSDQLFAAANITAAGITCAQITNGNAALKVWKKTNDDFFAYSGNDEVLIIYVISDTATVSQEEMEAFDPKSSGNGGFASAAFSNGKATAQLMGEEDLMGMK
jgi:hypothetical protein